MDDDDELLARELLGTPDESRLRVSRPPDHAAGVKAVIVAMGRGLREMGPSRTARTLSRLNQVDGFDCMSCAWPDPDPEHRHAAEFCENGAKAVAEEATRARVTPEFFALPRYRGRATGGAGQRTRP